MEIEALQQELDTLLKLKESADSILKKVKSEMTIFQKKLDNSGLCIEKDKIINKEPKWYHVYAESYYAKYVG